MKFINTLILLGILTMNVSAATKPFHQLLWEGNIPNNLTDENREKIEDQPDGDLFYSNVTIPDVQVFLPESTKPAAAVVICPGGGYWILSYKKEGTDIARFLARNGIAGIVLKYRLPEEKNVENKKYVPLQDAQRALQLVRQKSKDWNIDPAKVGILGFSAGGHLASTASHHWVKPVVEGASMEDVRPDFSVLIYPVVSTLSAGTHSGSRSRLLGDDQHKKDQLEFSAEQQVNYNTPPAFLVHAVDDGVVPVSNSIDYMLALKEYDIPCEAHLYQVGGHGFGLRPGHAVTWGDELVKWIRLNF